MNDSKINYIALSEINLRKTNGGFISMLIDSNYKIVSFYRCFPLSNENSYISIQDEEDNEIGIIKNLKSLSKEIKELIIYDLNIRYFMPKINKIIKLNDELGYFYWDVNTNCGFRKFTTKIGENNINIIRNTIIVIEDIDGNRYCIDNYKNFKGPNAKKLFSII